MISESLKELRDNFYGSAPKEIIDVIDKSITELFEDKLVEKAFKKGDKMPDFLLKNAVNEKVSLHGLLENGPIIINFYRGAW